MAKYIRKFTNNTEATSATDLVSPNVTYIEEGNKLLNIDCGDEKKIKDKTRW